MAESGSTRNVRVDTSRMPRIQPLEYDEVDEQLRKDWDELRPAPHRPRQNAEKDPDSFRIWMRHPALFRVRTQLVTYLMDTTVLPPRERELAIVRSGWLCGSDEQWVNHSKIGMACGLTQAEIDRIPAGPDAPGWSEHDAAIMRAVDELHDDCRIGEDTWTALAKRYDDAQLLELITLVGNYHSVAYLQNSVGIRPVGGSSPNLPGNRFLFPEP
jgi:alkylhydroperoxidase family enzyme